MISLENGLEKRKKCTFNLEGCRGGLVKKMKIKQRASKLKYTVTLKWLIWHEYISYVGAQDDPCDLVSGCEGHLTSPRQCKLLAFISSSCTQVCHILGSYQQKPFIFYYSMYLWLMYCDNFVSVKTHDTLAVTFLFAQNLFW